MTGQKSCRLALEGPPLWVRQLPLPSQHSAPAQETAPLPAPPHLQGKPWKSQETLSGPLRTWASYTCRPFLGASESWLCGTRKNQERGLKNATSENPDGEVHAAPRPPESLAWDRRTQDTRLPRGYKMVRLHRHSGCHPTMPEGREAGPMIPGYPF